ncbi:hypothetical protein H6P81_008263 [Aristolochia fimbriata]|uniref:Uncharacterized protein n=1 Tax=Aristolochia fimbriata TaxID=158543 RepID=A0AAV7F3R6_ARIFI|nr:hypothetical protein H6P81_008263 [Aristolochia fimbriata]
MATGSDRAAAEFPAATSRSGSVSAEFPATTSLSGEKQLLRQVGHEGLDASHPSMHLSWKPWLHLGSTRTFSPFTNSDKQMAHSDSAPASFIPAEYTSVGTAATAAGPRAAIFTSADILPEPAASASSAWRRRKQRMQALSARTPAREHTRMTRIIARDKEYIKRAYSTALGEDEDCHFLEQARSPVEPCRPVKKRSQQVSFSGGGFWWALWQSNKQTSFIMIGRKGFYFYPFQWTSAGYGNSVVSNVKAEESDGMDGLQVLLAAKAGLHVISLPPACDI